MAVKKTFATEDSDCLVMSSRPLLSDCYKKIITAKNAMKKYSRFYSMHLCELGGLCVYGGCNGSQKNFCHRRPKDTDCFVMVSPL